MMTKELHDKLTKYEHIFKTAIDARYIRAMDSRFAEDFINGCHELGVYINTSCPACVLTAAQTLGKLYFEYVPELNENTEDNNSINQEQRVHQSASKGKKKSK